MILDRLSNQELKSVALTVLELKIKGDKTGKTDKTDKVNKLVGYIFNYLKTKNMVIFKTKNLVDTEIESLENGDIIGFVFQDIYYCRGSGGKLNICNNVLRQKIAYLRELSGTVKTDEKYSEIIGYYENDGMKNNQFKIIDLTKTRKGKIKGIQLSRGRACMSHHIDNLFEIRKNLGMKKPDMSFKIRRETVCMEVEFYFRYLQEMGKGGVTWFISERVV
jgi:hypothetical protein